MGAGLSGVSCKISIVVPAYNDQTYVKRALKSCLGQTHKDIEVICVDDGSTDGTASVIRDVAMRDARVRPLYLSANVGTHDARAKGLSEATGNVVLFLDADDELTRDACATIAEQYYLDPFDILHFGTKVRSDGSAADRQDEALMDWVRPYAGVLQGRAIIDAAFVDLGYAFNLAGKAYRTPLAARAFEALGSQRLDFGEDALEYFAIAFFADKYRGLADKNLYVYHLGDGLSARADMTCEDFKRSLRGVASIKELKGFLQRQGSFDEYAGVYEAHCKNQLDALVRSWDERVAQPDKLDCLKLIVQLWPKDAVVTAVCKQGSQALDLLENVLDEPIGLSAEQLYLCAFADGARSVRAEYESSRSYKLGRTLSAIPRWMKNR